MCAQFSSLSCSVFVTLDCTPHRGSSFTCARHLRSSHDERISSTLSPPSPSTSSSSHSSFTTCTSSCTSSTTLRAVVTLRTSPERRWTPLTTPTSSQPLQGLSNSYMDLSFSVTVSVYVEWLSEISLSRVAPLGLWSQALDAHAKISVEFDSH